MKPKQNTKHESDKLVRDKILVIRDVVTAHHPYIASSRWGMCRLGVGVVDRVLINNFTPSLTPGFRISFESIAIAFSHNRNA